VVLVMQVLYERCAGIDVHKDQVTVAVRQPGRGRERQTTVRKFAAFYGVLREMTRWLSGQGVTHVAMEATGVYTMPVYHALLEPACFEQVLVCNAAHVKNVPGRKTDAVDASWLAELLECGLLAGSFIPAAEIKAVRDVVRYRRKIVQARSSETQRLGGVLQDAGIKLDSVASSIDTVSGLAMIRALIDGERRGQVLAELARGTMRRKIAGLSQALEGRFDDHHALMCQLHLDHIAQLNEMIARLDAQVESMMVPFARQQDLLATIPGSGLRPPRPSSPRSGPARHSSLRPPRTWHRGPGCARATTSPPESASTASPARAASTCSPSWSSPPGPRSRPRAASKPGTGGWSCGSAGSAAPPPRNAPSSPSPTP
jgi:transposase